MEVHVITEIDIEEAVLRGQIDTLLLQRKKEQEKKAWKEYREEIAKILRGIDLK